MLDVLTNLIFVLNLNKITSSLYQYLAVLSKTLTNNFNRTTMHLSDVY